MIKLYILSLSCILAITGCSRGPVSETPAEDAPETEQKIISFNLSSYTEDGSKKWELKGDSANVTQDLIYLTNISVDSYGDPAIKLVSDDGTYDKTSRVVTLYKNVLLTSTNGLTLITDSIEWDGAKDVIYTDEHVKIKRSDVIATGTGAHTEPGAKIFTLFKDVRVELLKDAMGGVSIEALKDLSDKDNERSKAVITCDGPLEIDYENNIAIFKNDVKVDDKRGQIYSDLMEAHMDPESKNITKVVAQGKVKVVRGEDSTYSDRAIYTTADQKIVLLGEPKIVIRADEEIEKAEREFRETKF